MIPLVCPSCQESFDLPPGVVDTTCPNISCHVPYKFKLHENEREAVGFHRDVPSWRTKYLFRPGNSEDTWAVAYFNGKIAPLTMVPISELIGENILRAMQGGFADNLGAPITLLEVCRQSSGEIALRRIEPLEYADRAERPPHMRRFVDFCAKLRLSRCGNVSGDDLCLQFDQKVAERYLRSPPYSPTWHFCWCHLIDYIVPVVVHGEVVGVLFSGQKQSTEVGEDHKLEEAVSSAARRLSLDREEMLAAARRAPTASESDICEDLHRLRGVAQSLETEAEEKYAVETQVREGYFFEEVEFHIAQAAIGSSITNEQGVPPLESTLGRIREFLQCFAYIALLLQDVEEEAEFTVLASLCASKSASGAKIDPAWFGPLAPDRLGVFLADSETRTELYEAALSVLERDRLAFAYFVRAALNSGRQVVLVVGAEPHQCRYKAKEGFCRQRSRIGEGFLANLGNTLRNSLEVVLTIERIKAEEGHREDFLVRTAHSLSLPMQSIIADSENLVREIDRSHAAYELAIHNYNEVQGLCLLVENILHLTGQKGFTRKFEYYPGCVLAVLREPCLMFEGEAREKGCDIRPIVLMNHEGMELAPHMLGDDFHLYLQSVYRKHLDLLGVPRDAHVRARDLSVRLCSGLFERAVGPAQLAKACWESLKSNAVPSRAVITYKSASIEVEAHEIAVDYWPPMEMVDAELSLAFKNLLHNAVKYSYRSVPTGKKRYVEVRVSRPENDRYRVEISNYGIGITSEELRTGQIWEAGYRGDFSHDRNRTGSGLGLAHVKQAIEDIHGGRLSAQSRPVPGGAYLTTFVVDLPMTQSGRLMPRWKGLDDGRTQDA